MSVSSEKFIRKSFYVDVVEVTSENLSGAAEWCGGFVVLQEQGVSLGDLLYVKVPVKNPEKESHTHARIGDKIVFDGRGYRVYNKRGFERTFDSVHLDLKKESRSVDLEKVITDNQEELLEKFSVVVPLPSEVFINRNKTDKEI